ncbi:hypothetical protein ISP15_00025 [Dyella jejuensis]|uniref:Uncharacterized protein n=1 Tax=Dyella jejuensis TaxID=1432009 RepID=A0ABW8JCA7_9GAMM
MGVATATTALLIGLPILSVPSTLEQHVVAHALERTGAAKTVEGVASLESIAWDIGELLGSPNYRQAAVQVAMKYIAVKFENNAQLLAEK